MKKKHIVKLKPKANTCSGAGADADAGAGASANVEAASCKLDILELVTGPSCFNILPDARK